ncbi:MAG: DEAD/DEAH box helicase, partial [Campylobacterota bacterium]
MEFSALPIAGRIDAIRSELLSSNRLIRHAPPGAGKTTAVPLSLLDEPWLEDKKIILLSPRRIAARTAAMRMADMLGEPLGQRVGYHIRGERRSGSQTRILVITEGILTRYLQNDPALEDTALVIFDEFHERNLHSDLSLAFALQAQETLRDDLKLMVMSATLDTRGLSELMESPPLITSEGRSFPVDVVYRPPAAPLPDPRNLLAETFRTLLDALRNDRGDILVFLPGEREIRDLAARLQAAEETRSDILIAPLYGNLTREEQQRAILPAPRRKIVLATNIAETSLTIEGIRIVIDAGFERLSRFDPASGMERLVTQRISRASADQRAGRAGRTSAGKCYRMWSEYAHQALSPFRDPDILTADLAPLALELAAWGSDDLRWIDPPRPSNLSHARE